MSECPWRTTGAWRALLGHLRPTSDLADSMPVPDYLHPPRMAKSPTGLRNGIPSSASRDAALHAVAARVPMPRDDKKNTRPKTYTQHVRAETGWLCLE